METLKKCTNCGDKKKLSEFYNSKTSKDGLDCYCKDCRRVYNKISYIPKAKPKKKKELPKRINIYHNKLWICKR